MQAHCGLASVQVPASALQNCSNLGGSPLTPCRLAPFAVANQRSVASKADLCLRTAIRQLHIGPTHRDPHCTEKRRPRCRSLSQLLRFSPVLRHSPLPLPLPASAFRRRPPSSLARPPWHQYKHRPAATHLLPLLLHQPSPASCFSSSPLV